MTTTHEDRDLARLIVHGTSAFELLRTALEFKLFEHLEQSKGMDLPGVAKALGVEIQPARILLLGLTALRLLRKEGGKYLNADITREKFLRSSPQYMGPLVEIQAKIINPSLLDLSESVRANSNVGLQRLSGPGDTLYQRLTAHPDLQKVFYDNMGDASRKAFPVVLDAFDFSTLHHVVDLGGGDGTNAIELTRRYPNLKVTIFDQESVCGIAMQNARRAGVGDRVHVHPGDLFKDPLPTGCDGVLSFHIFEMWSLKRNTELLRKCYAQLPEGGAVIVFAFACNDEDTGPLTPAIMSAYFLALATGEGMTYSLKDMETSVQNAGFKRTKRFQKPFFHGLVVGFK